MDSPSALLWAGGVPVAAALVLLVLVLSANGPQNGQVAPPGADVAAVTGGVPLAFEPNAGRWPDDVRFATRSGPGAIALTRDAIVASAPGTGRESDSIAIKFPGAALGAPEGIDSQPGLVNDFTGGRDSTGMPTFGAARWRNAYPGVDIEVHGRRGEVEYDFRVQPGADPGALESRLAGADSIRLRPDGTLEASSGNLRLTQRAPVAYQPSAEGRDRIPASFALAGNRIGFRLGAYDRSRPLVIDPIVLTSSTYLGGGGDDTGIAVTTDSAGATYFAGSTTSTDFDTSGAIEGNGPGEDAFVTKLNPAGNAIVYSTYLGGDDLDRANGIAVDAAGAAYVTGSTESTDFNTVGGIEGDADADLSDAFVTKLSPGGNSIVYSTYLGGSGNDYAQAIAVDAAGAAYFTGQTASADFDVVGGIEGDAAGFDVFVAKLTPTGNALSYSTYLGGSDHEGADGIAVGADGSAYIAGTTLSTDFDTSTPYEADPGDGNADAFASRLNPAGDALIWSTYLGGSDYDQATGIAIDSFGSAYLTGNTDSSDFDTMTPVQGDQPSEDGFVTKLTPSGSAIVYSTYLGGDGNFDRPYAIEVEEDGTAVIAGETSSGATFPLVDPIQTPKGFLDAFLVRLSPAGSAIEFSTLLGGTDNDSAYGLALGPGESMTIVGRTSSVDFPAKGAVEGNSASDDAFVTRLTDLEPPVEGENANAEPKQGRVFVNTPGPGGFRELEKGEKLPFGTTVDTTRGKIEITSDYNGKDQRMTFYDGIFTIQQSKGARPVVVVELTGPLNCGKKRIATTSRKGGKAGRKLWGNGKGNYKSKGKRGAATVRGTKWLTEDLCNGSTRFTLKRGKIEIDDFGIPGKRNAVLKGRGSYTAKR